MNHNKNKDLKLLGKKVKRLHKVSSKKIEKTVCDIIDLKGHSLAMLLYHLPDFSAKRQLQITRKIEDFLYFHPENGIKIFDRLVNTCRSVTKECQPMLLAAIADVSAHMPNQTTVLTNLDPEAEKTLKSSADYMRKAKALEILAINEKTETLPSIIYFLIDSTKNIEKFANYQFIENSLLVLKKLGGESLLRLLINPNSDNSIKNFKLEWRQKPEQLTNEILKISQKLTPDFAQAMLKIIDLSDFSMPFASMISEGITHPDKWVRQSAAASMQKANKSLDLENLSRLLNDPSPEVRLMAISSLGGFEASKTGELLIAVAKRESETIGARMNALHALYSQKNLDALESLSESTEPQITLHSIGLAALLKPKEKGFADILAFYRTCNTAWAGELNHYILELTEVEDLQKIVEFFASINTDVVRQNCLDLLKMFLNQKAGPRLEKVIAALTKSEKKALALLKSSH